MSPRAHGHSVRKVYRCGWRRWPKCSHSWYFSFKPRGSQRHRFSLDAEFKRHIGSKSEAETLASDIRDSIKAGTFRHAQTAPPASDVPAEAGVSLDAFAPVYLERGIQARGKATWVEGRCLPLEYLTESSRA